MYDTESEERKLKEKQNEEKMKEGKKPHWKDGKRSCP